MYLFLKGSLRRFLTKNKILNERRILMKKMIAILLSFVLMFFVLNAVLPGDVGTAIGLSVSVILNFLGGESAYVSALKTFLNSGKSTAYFKLCHFSLFFSHFHIYFFLELYGYCTI